MELPVLVAGVGATLLLVCVVALVARSRAVARRELAVALETSRAETAELRRRLDVLTEQLHHQSTSMVRMDDPAYVITDAGSTETTVPDRLVLSAAVGEPLVKAVALSHGVRRALSPEARNRIWFQVRREVRRARKQRRRETRDAWRRVQAEDRAAAAEGRRSTPPADAA